VSVATPLSFGEGLGERLKIAVAFPSFGGVAESWGGYLPHE